MASYFYGVDGCKNIQNTQRILDMFCLLRGLGPVAQWRGGCCSSMPLVTTSGGAECVFPVGTCMCTRTPCVHHLTCMMTYAYLADHRDQQRQVHKWPQWPHPVLLWLHKMKVSECETLIHNYMCLSVCLSLHTHMLIIYYQYINYMVHH